MNRQYEIREDGEDSYATLTRGDAYFEVPHSNDETDVQDRIDSCMLSLALGNFKPTQFRDDVYTDKEIVRQDYSILTDEGAAILQELKTAFPDYANYERREFNIVGKYDGYREPYKNASISWYDFGLPPSESLQLAFNTSYPNSNLKDWYGLKFDLVTDEVLLKAVIDEYAGNKPELPVGETFYAVTHSQDGTESEWIDAYVHATPKRIREFCAAKGLTYPLPENTHKECDVVWCWGFVFNKNTLAYGAVKGYARYNQ